MDRRFIFSKDEVIKKLNSEFIPVVGNTHELQNGHSKTRDWFIKSVSPVNSRVDRSETAQGFYVMAADGKAYGFSNNRGADVLLNAISKWKTAFEKESHPKVEITENDSYSTKQPAGTSVIRVFSRINPLPIGCDSSNETVARDHLWITPQDVDSIALSNSIPQNVQYRLARFHLVDNVRGEPDHWTREQVKSLKMELGKRMKVGNSVSYAITGDFSMQTDNGLRGIAGKLRGRLEIDTAKKVVKEWKVYSEATAWGQSTYTPNPPAGKFSMVFAMVNVKDTMSDVVPPQAIFFGNEYFRPTQN